MKSRVNEHRFLWLISGVVGGLCLAYFWPHEEAFAVATDRTDKFAICVVSTAPTQPDAIFVLDFLSGTLQGALLNSTTGTFTNYWYSNVVEDFELKAKGDKSRFTIIPGQGFLNSNAAQGGAGGTVASGVIYVGEVTSGKIGCYRFQYRNQIEAMLPVPLEKVAYFNFRREQK